MKRTEDKNRELEDKLQNIIEFLDNNASKSFIQVEKEPLEKWI